MKEKTFSREVKMAIAEAYSGYCANCHLPATDFHHRIHNTKGNRKKFPLFIQSPMNCVPLCRKCHDQYHWKFDIPERVAEVYEKWLEELKNGK